MGTNIERDKAPWWIKALLVATLLLLAGAMCIAAMVVVSVVNDMAS